MTNAIGFENAETEKFTSLAEWHGNQIMSPRVVCTDLNSVEERGAHESVVVGCILNEVTSYAVTKLGTRIL